MGAAVRRQKNGADAADDPAHLIGWCGAGEQIGKDAAGLARPRGAAILGEFDQAGATDAPEHTRTWRRNQTRIGDGHDFHHRSRAAKACHRSGRSWRWRGNPGSLHLSLLVVGLAEWSGTRYFWSVGIGLIL